MTAIRFDADEDTVAEEDPELTEEWGSYAESIWYLTDGMSNGRWLFVDPPSPGNGVPLGIGRVYTKYLSPEAAESLADALRLAATEAREMEAERKRVAEEQRLARERCEKELGGHDWPVPENWIGTPLMCSRCGTSQAILWSTSSTSLRTPIAWGGSKP